MQVHVLRRGHLDLPEILVRGGVRTRSGGQCHLPCRDRLDANAIAQVQEGVRRRLLRSFVRRGLLPGDEARAMPAGQHGGGFSVDASVRIEATDRPGRERLLRLCARPPFALERLRELGSERLLYANTKARSGREPPPAPDAAATARPPRRPGAAAARPSAPLLRRAGTGLAAAPGGDARCGRATVKRLLSRFPATASGGQSCLQWVELSRSADRLNSVGASGRQIANSNQTA